jgi:phage tail sheath protein FI
MPNPAQFPGVYLTETPGGAPPIQAVATAVTAFVGTAPSGPLHQAVQIFGFVDYEREFGGLHPQSELSYAVLQFFENGGKQAYVVRVADTALATDEVFAAFVGTPAQGMGIHTLDAIDHFNLLCLPGLEDMALIRHAVGYCVKRRAFLILDAPAAIDTATQMAHWVQSGGLPLSDHAAVYFPRVVIADPLNKGKPRPCAPSGTIAGLYARMDAQRGVWKAPAGLEASLLGVQTFTHALTKTDLERLIPLGINGLRSLPSEGPVAWGARTLQGGQASAEYKYVPIRRLALFLEASIERGTRWAAFEPNDAPLWMSLRASIESFLDGLFRQGAFLGRTPREAYWVRCGPDTTLPAEIMRGELNIELGFAAMKPAEFLLIRVQLKTA